jgi:DNA helicase-2/ATP-dependent DNA helicase PcrA
MFGSTLEELPAHLARLNERQREAASYGGRTLLVLAGAGTGKTATLCARVAWLLGEGVPAERILLLSFTRRAAREMVERARTLAQREAPTSGRIVGGTFHSVAHRQVRQHASSLGLGAGFGVLDASDAADLIDLIRQERGHAESRRRFPRAHTLLDIYSRVVNAQAPLAEVLAQHFPWCAEHHEQLGEAFRAYAARKRALGVLDLDDLLLYWRALLADATTGPGIAEGFEHVLVDEYQDVNGLQVEIVRHLSSRGAGLTVVGDDFQAIYGFRAASARHILDFPAQFADAHTVKLECNYRSTNPILAVANAVSEQDCTGYPKRLFSEREGGIEPELCFPRDDAEQAREVCERVQAAREEAIDLRAQAVLFRTGHDCDLLELELTRRGIPFVKYGGLRFLEAAHVKDLIALLRLLGNPADELSWFRVLQLLDGVGPTRARRMLQALRGEAHAGGAAAAHAGAAAVASAPHPDAAAEASSAPALSRLQEAAALVPEGSREHADALFGALAAAAAEANARPEQIVERLCAAIAPLIRLRYEDGEVRVGDLEQLAASARGASDVRHFVSELVLDPPVSSADLAGPPHLDEDFLVLSTVHSAKGLEWEAVHVISAYDGNFPADMNTAGEEGVAEERRLFYVALTRARRRLHVYVPQRYYHRPGARDDAHGCAQASRYLSRHVQSLFSVSRPAAEEVELGAPALGAARIEVSVDALFGG